MDAYRIHKQMYYMMMTCLITHEYLIMIHILISLPLDDTQLVSPPRKNFELALVENGRHQNHYPLQHDEEEDNDLEKCCSV